MMRILQVVTLVSPDGAYGGPVRVALNQSAELMRQGHEVVIAAATRGYRDPPAEIDGVQLQLFEARKLIPHMGFAGIGAPGLVRWFRRAAGSFDVVHIHFARDLVVLPVAMSARHRGLPYVLQTHGMVTPSAHPLAAPLDTLWTRRALRGAGAVFHLTAQERDDLIAVAGPHLELVHLVNGVPGYPAATRVGGAPEVLFAARLHERKRPLIFVEMAEMLLAAGVDAHFALVGPDEGEGPAVRAAVAGHPRITWEGGVSHSEMPSRMTNASLYVLPSVREPYPMAVLEAMSIGLPVVVSDDCGLAELVRRSNCGIVASPSAAALASAVGHILADRHDGCAMGERGRTVVQRDYTMSVVCSQLFSAYSKLVDGNG